MADDSSHYPEKGKQMKPLLSICIPSLNRPEFLLQAVNSIHAGKASLEKIEICISNNFSDLDYSEVEEKFESAASVCNVKYIRHNTRLSLDENMHYVKKMASGDFIYFLGDDDCFLMDQIDILVEFIGAKEPDLAIFNGHLVDANNCYLGRHFNLPSKEYRAHDDAFMDLRDKGMFGAVLVRRDLLQDDDFIKLYGTSHAYGCYWLSIMREYERNNNAKIFIPDFPCVALRCTKKNYNHIYVYYRDIPYELAVYKRFTEPRMLQLITKFERSQNKKISSIRFLCSLSDFGCDLNSIEIVNPLFYENNKLIIKVSKFIASSMGYKLIKKLYQKHVRAAELTAPIFRLP